MRASMMQVQSQASGRPRRGAAVASQALAEANTPPVTPKEVWAAPSHPLLEPEVLAVETKEQRIAFARHVEKKGFGVFRLPERLQPSRFPKLLWALLFLVMTVTSTNAEGKLSDSSEIAELSTPWAARQWEDMKAKAGGMVEQLNRQVQMAADVASKYLSMLMPFIEEVADPRNDSAEVTAKLDAAKADPDAIQRFRDGMVFIIAIQTFFLLLLPDSVSWVMVAERHAEAVFGKNPTAAQVAAYEAELGGMKPLKAHRVKVEAGQCVCIRGYLLHAGDEGQANTMSVRIHFYSSPGFKPEHEKHYLKQWDDELPTQLITGLKQIAKAAARKAKVEAEAEQKVQEKAAKRARSVARPPQHFEP
ncbi:hypothetical protein V8C86DRAFT_2433249 [Haematococcus lacustris]